MTPARRGSRSERKRERPPHGGGVADAPPEDRVAVMGQCHVEGSTSAAGRPPADVPEASVYPERLVGAARTAVRHLNRAADEVPGDEREAAVVRPGELQARARDGGGRPTVW